MNFSNRLLLVLAVTSMLPLVLSLYISWTYIRVVWKPSPSFARMVQKTREAQTASGIAKELMLQQRALQASYFWASVALVGGALFVVLLAGWLLLRSLSTRLFVMQTQIHQTAPELFALQHDEERHLIPLEALQRDIWQLLVQFRESQQNEVFKEQVARWQDVARRLAHEIRNPLTPILLAVQELHQRYPEQSGTFRKQLNLCMEIVHEEVETLQRLVEEFSSFAKLPQIRPQPEDLNQIIRDFLDAYGWFRPKATIHFETHCPENAWVSIDRMLFRRVLHNLVENAIEAGSPTLTIRIGALQNRDILCQLEDRGPGIPEHLHSKIFTPYYTTKQFGTGLGLSITKKIVIDHGGTISVAPNPGGGSVFTVKLKNIPAPPQGPKTAES